VYVTTFYSFKGGVGRTLALVNVAVELALQGRRVLMVDFDLEAPGLCSFDISKSSCDANGIVDFVSYYMKYDATPDVRKYVAECALPGTKRGGALFVMPSGKSDDTYGRRLADIDWTDLYRSQHGYKMIEDLKAQWADAFNPDYVFIDSRTGHTEEGGICTRQLPDAVVVLFFPNEQNLVGLRKVVSDIRSAARTKQRKIPIHFVASNVPDVSDDDGILRDRLEKFQNTLEFKSFQTVYHYPSLALLNQEIFVLHRRRSRLANEYRTLLQSIIEQNPADKYGALALLRTIGGPDAETPRTSGEQEEVHSKLTRIREQHVDDPEIIAAVARVHARIGELHKAKAMLDAAVSNGLGGAAILRQRSNVNMLLGNTEAAADDLLSTLENEGTELTDVMIAFEAIKEQAPRRLLGALHSKAFRALGPEEQSFVGASLMDNPQAMEVAEALFRRLYVESPERPYARVNLSLCFVHFRRYDAVMSLLGPRERLLSGANVQLPDIFNFAMADWAAHESVPVDLFRRFLDTLKPGSEAANDANFYQCQAIASWCVGDEDQARVSLETCRAKIDSLAVPTFSAWRYMIASPSEFQEDLDAIERLLRGQAVLPTFMREPPETVY
jgi:MinD-like ATPase involved in chromosome partitioning or flagellar assembly